MDQSAEVLWTSLWKYCGSSCRGVVDQSVGVVDHPVDVLWISM